MTTENTSAATGQSGPSLSGDGPAVSGDYYRQMTKVVVCQICARAMRRADAEKDGWLVAPWKNRRRDAPVDALVVRCYRHISVKALRNSFAGRTKYWLAKMAEGRQRAIDNPDPPFSVFGEPFPFTDRLLEDLPEDAADPVRRRSDM